MKRLITISVLVLLVSLLSGCHEVHYSRHRVQRHSTCVIRPIPRPPHRVIHVSPPRVLHRGHHRR